MKNENEAYLSDWLAQKISDEQLKLLVGEKEFKAYQKLKEALNDFTVNAPNMEQNFSAIQQKIKAQKEEKKSNVFLLWYSAGVAAAILLLVGLFQLFYFSNTVETACGINKIELLPDNSRVTLNAKSKLSYPTLFRYNRTLTLDGEAFFEVQKGSDFTVKTDLGSVKVLGTKFNVIAYKDYFEVVCYEGKVRVQSKDRFTILTPTESVRFYDNHCENWADNLVKAPSWIYGESTFKNVPIKYVINELKNQYDVDVQFPENLENVKFTGTFTHKKLETALKSICIPLRLNYAKTSSGKIIISK
ncbi:FecR family protein [Flavobacterium sp. XGLA_31]|uniref:FecR family protein n=1 Tax=Flavobacterium sp. XGLA_31 TaxID=3447666 RepID=UPI003F3D77F7